MKKIKVILLIGLIIITTGCGKQKQLDIKSIEEKLVSSGMFKGNKNYTLDEIKEKYDVDLSSINEYIISLPDTSEKANMYIISNSKPKESILLKDQLEDLVKKYDASWTTLIYNQEEAYKVKNLYFEKYNNYYIYIISDNNKEVIRIIKE